MPALCVMALSLLLGDHLLAQGGQPTITAVTFNPASVVGGRNATATISISAPAGNNGYDISLALTSNAAQLSASRVTIGADQTTATVTVSTLPTAVAQVATLTATSRNSTNRGNLSVTPPSLATLAFNPVGVTVSAAAGASVLGTATLDGGAPTGGLTVVLASNNSSLAVPATVTVAAGATSTSFNALASPSTSGANVTVTASLGLSVRTADVNIRVPLVQSVAAVPPLLQRLEFGKVRVTLDVAAPAGGVNVAITRTGFAAVRVPTSVPVPAGQTIGEGTIAPETRMAATAEDTVSNTLTATLHGSSRSTSLTIVVNPPVPITLTGFRLSTTQLSAAKVVATASISAPAPKGGVRVGLAASSSVTAAFKVPTEIIVPEGATSASVTLDPLNVLVRSVSGTVSAGLDPKVITVAVQVF